jgi:hypothetical protein
MWSLLNLNILLIPHCTTLRTTHTCLSDRQRNINLSSVLQGPIFGDSHTLMSTWLRLVYQVILHTKPMDLHISTNVHSQSYYFVLATASESKVVVTCQWVGGTSIVMFCHRQHGRVVVLMTRMLSSWLSTHHNCVCCDVGPLRVMVTAMVCERGDLKRVSTWSLRLMHLVGAGMDTGLL